MKTIKFIFRKSIYLIWLLLAYFIISLLCSWVSVNNVQGKKNRDQIIYLNTNGVHLDIIMPIQMIDKSVLNGINHNENELYLSFGWGDENFYINTPTWDDLTFSNAFQAMFLESSTLMHVNRYNIKGADWIEVKINNEELENLNTFLLQSFDSDTMGEKIWLKNAGYTNHDDFYKAKGSYSCFNTCNSWANKAFKESGLKSALWTPFDFGLLWKYE